MKKLLSIFCSVLCIHSISQTPVSAGNISQKASGEKVLMKALSAIINPEANKKVPVKTINLYSSERP